MHQVAMSSGSGLATWASDATGDVSTFTSLRIGDNLNCARGPGLVDCLRRASAAELLTAEPVSFQMVQIRWRDVQFGVETELYRPIVPNREQRFLNRRPLTSMIGVADVEMGFLCTLLFGVRFVLR